MTLCEADLQTLCDAAVEAAQIAGRYVSETRPQRVEHKQDGESLAAQVVTEVDRHAQQLILERLAPTIAQYDLGLLTEESPDDGSRLLKDYFWCIDPVDGTLCFIEGQPGYAVSIALVSRAGEPTIGVVYDPVQHVVYRAARGGGASRNAEPWTVEQALMTRAPIIFTDRSEAKRASFQPVARALNATAGGHGGAVMNAIWCLEQPPACYFKFAKTQPGGGCFWDFAATACIYSEAGGWVSDALGEPLRFHRADTIHLNHCGVLYASHEAVARRVLATR
jgi:3'-phosphoadenosine 5'-phosphosulfate (PAPS) 3'-phosphatase